MGLVRYYDIAIGYVIVPIFRYSNRDCRKWQCDFIQFVFYFLSDETCHIVNITYELPDITGRTALAVRPDVVNGKYHVITNATYNRDPVPAKFKHVTNIDTCTLLCCDYSTLWEALHVNC